ncbi:MAG: CaiB/BaiF CoA transferase family protein [Acidimicrobiales bacterium]|jgi:crotonobetainyl-CoA:carnitine CoA-transferase CaiB-like acyl-CoA transferase
MDPAGQHATPEESAGSDPSGPLRGIRVVDLSSVVMGPYATQLMADLGADVVTIEPAAGDTNRRMSTGPHPDLSGVALNLLRNKRNVAIDLKSEDGHRVLVALICSADVFLTNLRPGSLDRLGLNYEDVKAMNPGIVYCSAQGFPADGERYDDPAYDDVIQADTGLVDAMRRATGTAAMFPSLVADKVSGLSLAFAVTAALVHRARTGEGRSVQVAMSEAVRSFVLVEHGAGAVPDEPRGDVGYERILTRARQPQPTADGWICMFPYQRAHYERLAAEVTTTGEKATWLPGANRDPTAMYELLNSVTPTRTTAEWLVWCKEAGIPAAPVKSLDELVDELPLAVHPKAGRYRVTPMPARIEGVAAGTPRPAPTIGEHNRSVCSELGYSDADIDRFEAAGVLWTRSAPRSDAGTEPGRGR